MKNETQKLNVLDLAQKFHTSAQHQTSLVAKLSAVSETFNFRSRMTWKNMLQQFMKRWNLSKIERLWSCPKVSHISTTSNYSGSQSLSSIWEIQFSIFFLNFLKQNWKWNSKIERHGSWPKVSHISTTSNYSGSQTFSKFGDIQFSITNNMKEHVAAVHEEMKPFKNWAPRILAKSVPHQHNIKLFW